MRQTEIEIDFAADAAGARWANLHRRMPAPQYLGAKYKLLPWLCEFVPESADTILDGFSGSQSFSFEMKKRNCTVHSNDFLGFCHAQGVALVENKRSVLTDDDVELLFCENANRTDTMLRFKDIFFTRKNAFFSIIFEPMWICLTAPINARSR